jgi:hypothetical protein
MNRQLSKSYYQHCDEHAIAVRTKVVIFTKYTMYICHIFDLTLFRLSKLIQKYHSLSYNLTLRLDFIDKFYMDFKKTLTI